MDKKDCLFEWQPFPASNSVRWKLLSVINEVPIYIIYNDSPKEFVVWNFLGRGLYERQDASFDNLEEAKSYGTKIAIEMGWTIIPLNMKALL
jgi:hypothetical protein